MPLVEREFVGAEVGLRSGEFLDRRAVDDGDAQRVNSEAELLAQLSPTLAAWTAQFGEVGLAGWTVYVDLNSNGALDAGEPSTLTNPDGSYLIADVPAGAQQVRLAGQVGWYATGVGANQVVTVLDQTIHTVNFGVVENPNN